ncbi:NAD(P)/FAD-dependent oxidoreductase [Alkalimarinus sediminis]|uniref:FAD-dependent oxidoreductase n=1 Tax=Alkalimarinus sediminis TaxID=1632866 RepID=A0A9E8HKE3_9ALTE|nr:FAD-dependent oxidoreductase [Alkalimarinus sediminis]UZW75955.1 FAD-dependent oxidoreductase [Alkalimarinus sediminis]
MSQKQNIAIIGSGIAGLTAGYLLSKQHNVTLFEANDYLGGHTHTRNVELGGKTYPVNTGFIVFNDWTYPNFIELMAQLGVKSEASDMSFSVRCENTGLEYNGTSLNSLFAQRLNIVNPKFIRMVYDIVRFNKQTVAALEDEAVSDEQTLGEFVKENGYSDAFVNYYIIPMGAAIWSASVDVMMEFPLKFFLRFFNNHGMLSVDDRPQWRVISGGSRSYIEPITRPYKDNIKLNTAIVAVSRDDNGVELTTQTGEKYYFDQVVFACHSDQALRMLEEPTEKENEILGALPYQMNQVVLHTDERLMPKKKLAWAAWNYHIPQRANDCAMVTYNMNKLQNFDDAPETLLVTLNRSQEIDPAKVIDSYQYSHPVFTLDGVKAQGRHSEISGHNRTHYCGAYWFNGFHEDGVNSGLRVAEAFGISL